ncbi:MAG: hypothetical protein WC373_11055 [Smithella sp.]|jgi:CHASE3 domain sensor protein
MFKNWPKAEKILVLVCLFLLAGLFVFIFSISFISCTGSESVTETIIIPADTSALENQLNEANVKLNEANNQAAIWREKANQYEIDKNKYFGDWWAARQDWEKALNDAADCHADNENYKKLLDESNGKITFLKNWMIGIVDGSDNLTTAGMTDSAKKAFRQDFKELWVELPDWVWQ